MNRVESLREFGDCKKNLRKSFGDITAERDYFEKKCNITNI